jgi:hypothetical protein
MDIGAAGPNRCNVSKMRRLDRRLLLSRYAGNKFYFPGSEYHFPIIILVDKIRKPVTHFPNVHFRFNFLPDDSYQPTVIFSL